MRIRRRRVLPSPRRPPSGQRGRCPPEWPGRGLNQARHLVAFADTTSRRTTTRLFSETPGDGGVRHPGRGRPVPPIDHRARAEVGPAVGASHQEYPTVAGGLESHEWAGATEIDEIEPAPDRPLERHLHRLGDILPVLHHHADVQVAVHPGRVSVNRPEEDCQAHTRHSLEDPCELVGGRHRVHSTLTIPPCRDRRPAQAGLRIRLDINSGEPRINAARDLITSSS